jgi:hypothetical protein
MCLPVRIQTHLFNQEITARQAESIVPDAIARQNALNFLLAVGLLKGMTSSSGQISFRAVSKEEIVACVVLPCMTRLIS